MKRLLFCTSFLTATTLARWEHWFSYYRQLSFGGELVSFNDGPIPVDTDRRQGTFVELLPHLGRKTLQLFPGWKRGFSEGLRYGIENGFDSIIHIESDLYIRRYYSERFHRYFDREGYYSGSSRIHQVMETSFQIINDISVAKRLCCFFSKPANQYEARSAEWQIMSQVQPRYISKGERLEKDIDRLLLDFRYEYYAQCDFEKYREHIFRGLKPSDLLRMPCFAAIEMAERGTRRIGRWWHRVDPPGETSAH